MRKCIKVHVYSAIISVHNGGTDESSGKVGCICFCTKLGNTYDISPNMEKASRSCLSSSSELKSPTNM